MLSVYHSLTTLGKPALRWVLSSRLRQGKEDAARLSERMGQPGQPRPPGPLLWFHAASVGEAQSTLILVEALLACRSDLHVLVTSGTVTSANLMASRLPDRAIHQYYPLDHPEWVAAFLDHWKPDAILWMESELWPNMLRAIRQRNISAALMNARLSRKSYRRWKKLRKTAGELLSTFELFLAQTEEDAQSFSELGAINVRVRDNLKYSAAPLPHDIFDLVQLKAALQGRPFWLYASTHQGEEEIAAHIHKTLKEQFPKLLTIIVPRHPERRDSIMASLAGYGLNVTLRGADKIPPAPEDDIYIADTLGELGLFYRLAPLACIGRSFSKDGGGGHNPIEAAQLGCAVLYGENVQNLTHIYKEMTCAEAALCMRTPEELGITVARLLGDPAALETLRKAGLAFADSKSRLLAQVLKDLEPMLVDHGIVEEGQLCA